MGKRVDLPVGEAFENLRLTRRGFHKAVVCSAAATMFSGQETARSEPVATATALQILSGIVNRHASVPGNAWRVIHGVRAMGLSFKVGEESAVDYLCRVHLQQMQVDQRSFLYMPPTEEGHPHCFLSEAILDAGVPLDHEFRREDMSHKVSELVEGAKALFRFDSGTKADDLAWTLSAFAQTTDPANNSWTNAYGSRIKLAEVIAFAMDDLERRTAALQSAMGYSSDIPASDRIHELACAGTHLLYGLLSCLRNGHEITSLRQRLKPQFEMLVWRLRNDPRLIDAHYDALAGEHPPELVLMYRLDTKLKFLGHALEIFNFVRSSQLFDISPQQHGAVAEAQRHLAGVVTAIDRADIERYENEGELFNLLIGDACHAYHALNMAEA